MTTETTVVSSWARSTAWLVAANVLRNLGLLAVLLVLGQLTNPAVVGRYALALAITSPIFVLAQLGLKGVYLTLRSNNRFSSFVLVQVAAVIVAFLAGVALALAINPSLVSTVALVCLVKAVDCGFELGSGALQRYGRTQVVFWSYLAAAVLGVVAVVLILILTKNLDLALAGLGVANAVVALASTLRVGLVLARHHEARLIPASRRVEIIGILRAGVPTGVAMAVLALVASLPQYFLAANWGERAVGYFAVLLYLVAIADIFGGTLTQAWIPSARAHLEPDKSLDQERKSFLSFTFAEAARWTLIFFPLVALGLWLAGIVLPVAMSPEYGVTLQLAVPLAAGILLLPLLHFGGTAIAVLNLYAHGITLSLVAAGASVAGCLALVPRFGLPGALWATAFAYLARAIATLVVLITQGSRGTMTARPPPPVMPPNMP